MTRFFRDPDQCELFSSHFIPGYPRALDGRLTIWCIGCSTGEEPYTIGMLCDAHLPDRVTWHIDASDTDEKALSIARKGTYESEKIGEIPENMRNRYTNRREKGFHEITSAIRDRIEFFRADIAEMYRSTTAYDAIFLRHVLPYLPDERKTAVLKNVWFHLAPGGVLFTGRSESIDPFQSIVSDLRVISTNLGTCYVKSTY